MCGKVLAVPCCTRESCSTLLCILRVAPKIIVYSHAKMCQGQRDLQTVEIPCFACLVPGMGCLLLVEEGGV
jgi:hypothetical protein